MLSSLNRPSGALSVDPEPRRASIGAALVETAIGTLLLCLSGAASFAVAHHHQPYAIDNRIFSIVPPEYHNRWLDTVADLGSAPVLVMAIAIAAITATYRRAVRISLSCILGPTLTVLVTQLIVKQAVDRRLGGGLSFPSGHVIAATVAASAIILAAPRRWRVYVAVLGVIAMLAVSVAVVSLGWHYPTDAIAGLLYGVGGVTFVDGILRLVFKRSSR